VKQCVISPYSRKMRNGNEHNPKDYPFWNELINLLKEEYDIIQIGMPGEKKLDGVKDFLIGKPLDELTEMVKYQDLLVAVDNFFPHLCHLIPKPGVVLFGPSDPLIFGHKENINILKDRKYLREKQFDIWEVLPCDNDRFCSPEEVMKIIKQSSVYCAA
jgi:ADP-heptose:LPS heptosyltransferase